MDNETKQIIEEQQKLKLLTEHEGWGIARKLLTDKILELQMIGNIDKSSPDKALMELIAREAAAHTLFEWLKDIEGNVDQMKGNNNLTLIEKTHIIRV